MHAATLLPSLLILLSKNISQEFSVTFVASKCRLQMLENAIDFSV